MGKQYRSGFGWVVQIQDLLWGCKEGVSWASEELTGVRVLASQMAHSSGWQVGAGCWQEASVAGLLDFSKGLLECP